MKRIRLFGCFAGGLIGLQMMASADTLVLRDGRRVEGELLSLHDGIIEFEGARGAFGRERFQVRRADVVRIELDEPYQGAVRQNNGGFGGSQRPAGLREHDVNVESTRHWNDTGIEVRAGQKIYFVAAGQVHWGPGRQDGAGGEQGSPYNATRPIPGRPAASLIARIGEGADYIFIGDDRGPIPIRSNGRLYLGINDDNLQDNSGSLRVTVYY
jgi:hypothetical protein